MSKNTNEAVMQKSLYKNIIALILAGSLASILTQADAAAFTARNNGKIITLAQPEVWGYDLSNNELVPEGYNVSIAYHAPNGDVVFLMRKCIENCNKPFKEKYEKAMLWFLAGKLEFTNDSIAYQEQHQLKFHNSDQAKLPNGQCIQRFYHSTGSLCQINSIAQDFLIKGPCAFLNDPNKINEVDIALNTIPEIERYTIIAAAQDIYRYTEKPDGLCEHGGPGGGELIYTQLYPMLNIIGLKDGTFIIKSGNLLIRFDHNLKTKFTAKHDVELSYNEVIKGNFFVLPYEKIEELRNIVAINDDHRVQGLHDELLLYLYRRQENNSN